VQNWERTTELTLWRSESSAESLSCSSSLITLAEDLEHAQSTLASFEMKHFDSHPDSRWKTIYL
jgi:hypothetical protein